MDIFATFATDEKKELEGASVPFGGDGAYITVARLGNRRYGRELAKRIEENQVALNRKDDEADKLSDKIMAEVLADTILLGWTGMKYQGVEFYYSRDNAVKALLHADFRRRVVEEAGKFDHFRATQEVEQGNA